MSAAAESGVGKRSQNRSRDAWLVKMKSQCFMAKSNNITKPQTI